MATGLCRLMYGWAVTQDSGARFRHDLSDWLNVTNAAKHMGITPDALRQRIRRDKALARRGNDGRLLVYVDASRPGQTEQQTIPRPI